MNTPTPEDIRLAEELTECWWLNKEKAQAIIAAHTAPLRELAEIGRLYCEHRKAAREYDVCDYDHAPTLEAHALRYDRTFDALRDAYNTYLAKKIKP